MTDGARRTRLEQGVQAVRLTAPVAAAYLPLGAAFGVLLVTSGINWYWAPLSALVIFAGSIELLAVHLIVSGASLPQVALTALAVNFRHAFYGLTFPLSRLHRRTQRLYGVFALTDETYGITAAGEGSRLNGFQITVLQAVSQLWWVSGALFGSLVGQVIPADVKGFGFSLTAMFAILATDAVRTSDDHRLLFLAVHACIAAYIADHFVYDGSFLVVGFLVYLALLTYDYVGREPASADDQQP